MTRLLVEMKVSALAMGLVNVSRKLLAARLTTSGAKGFRLSAPPTARGEEFRAEAMAAYEETRPGGICWRRA